MQATIDRQVTITFGGKAKWIVKSAAIVNGDDMEFVKLRTSDFTLIKLLAEGVVGNLPKNPSLATCPGIRDLIRLRNEQQRSDLATEVPPKKSLFDGQPATKKRHTMVQLKRLRDKPEALKITVPGYDGRDAMEISVLRPVHPCDELAVHLSQPELTFVLGFIRHAGIDESMLQAKRVYASAGSERGVWKLGLGFVVKTENDGYKRAKTLEDAVRLKHSGPAPLTDQA